MGKSLVFSWFGVTLFLFHNINLLLDFIFTSTCFNSPNYTLTKIPKMPTLKTSSHARKHIWHPEMSLIKFLEHTFSSLAVYKLRNIVSCWEATNWRKFYQLAGFACCGCFCVSELVLNTHLPNHRTRYHASARRDDSIGTSSQAIELATEVLQVFPLVSLFCLFPAAVGWLGWTDHVCCG